MAGRHRPLPTLFIGLLGEQYNCVPKRAEMPDDLLDGQKWLEDHFACSVTELEVLGDMLDNLQ